MHQGWEGGSEKNKIFNDKGGRQKVFFNDKRGGGQIWLKYKYIVAQKEIQLLGEIY